MGAEDPRQDCGEGPPRAHPQIRQGGRGRGEETRRERLAKLYSEEMAQWRHEVATSGKSAADRKAEVEAKALESRPARQK